MSIKFTPDAAIFTRACPGPGVGVGRSAYFRFSTPPGCSKNTACMAVILECNSAMQIPLPDRLDRLTRWLEMRNDRPLLGFSLGSYYPLRRYPNGVRRLKEGVITPDDVIVGDYLEDTERLYQLHGEAGGDFVFTAAPFLGLPWVEAPPGCTVIADHQTGSTRSLPPPSFSGVPAFSDSNSWVARM